MTVAHKPLDGARILVAEDEAILALDMICLLSKAGAEVIGPAMTVERALQLANEEDVDCGILDVSLGDGPVFPAAEVLKRKGAGLVFHTGHPDPDAIARQWPAAKVLAKPAPMKVLMAMVIEVCRCSI